MHKELAQAIHDLMQIEKQSFPLQAVRNWYEQLQLTKELLKPYTFFNDNKYTRNLIADSDNFELVLLCWAPNTNAPIHGHEGQKCWMKVVHGQLRFVCYEEVARTPEMQLQKVSDNVGGAGFIDGPAHIHAVQNCFSQPAISLHLYARPIRECDVYNVQKHCIERKKIEYDTKYGKPV